MILSLPFDGLAERGRPKTLRLDGETESQKCKHGTGSVFGRRLSSCYRDYDEISNFGHLSSATLFVMGRDIQEFVSPYLIPKALEMAKTSGRATALNGINGYQRKRKIIMEVLIGNNKGIENLEYNHKIQM